jgi:two-component system chemotaxis response regulator CheB
VAVDHVLPLAEMPALLARLARGIASAPACGPSPMTDEIESDRGAREIDGGARENEALGGTLSGLTCPECHGALWEIKSADGVRYRCRVGHAFSEEVLDDTKGVSIEAALWTALTALEEHAALSWRMARRAEQQGHDERRRRYEAKAHLLEGRARLIARVLHETPLAVHDGAPLHDTGAP